MNFGSCSYLGLEQHPLLKEAVIDSVKRYGTQFSSSRVFVSCGNYVELEHLLGEIFNPNLIVTPSVSLGHQAVMPIIIEGEDAVISDQLTHYSMQELFPLLKHNGTYVTVLRHSRLDELERKILELRDKHEKIWYVIDGVYSMYGDFAPIEEIVALMDKYKQLHLYVDDAHGMSWVGPNGAGYIYSKVKHHPKMVLAVSLNKAFATGGGAFIFPNQEWRDKVKYWGGSLSHSGPLKPHVVGSAIASAKKSLVRRDS